MCVWMLLSHLVHKQQEKQRLYHEIKAILARQPGPEVAEQLSVYQARYVNHYHTLHTRVHMMLTHYFDQCLLCSLT
jgi:hypothetical protein